MFNTESSLKDHGVTSMDHLQLLGCFLLTVVTVYFLPKSVGYVVVGVFLFWALVDRKNYWWIAFFLVLSFTPLGLFSETSDRSPLRLPVFSLGGGLSFMTFDLFVLLFLGKAFFSPEPYRSTFRKPWTLILLYALFLLLVSFFIHGTALSTLFNHLRFTVYFSLLFSIPVLLNSWENFRRVLRLFQPYVFLVLFGALFFFASGGLYLYSFFNPLFQIRQIGLGLEGVEFTHRFLLHGGQFDILFLGFVFSLVDHLISKRTLSMIIALVCFLVIILSGTRSWFIIFSFIALVYFLLSDHKSAMLRNLGLTVAVFAALMVFSPMSAGFSASWARVETVFSLADESSFAVQTLEHKREVRLGRQLDLLRKSPVFGMGFTDAFIDGDVGNFALLAETGFFGFILFLYLWITFLRQTGRARRLPGAGKPYRQAAGILSAAMIGLLMSHFTTNQIFGLDSRPVLVSVFFAGSGLFLNKVFALGEASKPSPAASEPLRTPPRSALPA